MSWCLNLHFSFVYMYCLYQVLYIFLCENTLRTKINNFPVWESAPAPHTVLSTYHLQQLWRKRFCSSPGRSRLELFWTLLPKGVPWRMPSQSHLFLILEASHLLTIYLLPCIEKNAAKVPFFRHKNLKLREMHEWGEAPSCTVMCRQANIGCLGTLTTVWSLARNAAYLNCSTPADLRIHTDLTAVVCLTNITSNALAEALHYDAELLQWCARSSLFFEYSLLRSNFTLFINVFHFTFKCVRQAKPLW